MRRARSAILTVLPALVLATGFAGCSILPAVGPTATEVERVNTGEHASNFDFIKLDSRILSILAQDRSVRLSQSFGRSGYKPTGALRVGDVVAVTIYESGGSSLFGAPTTVPGATQPAAGAPTQIPTTIPPQVIEPSGEIMIPFAGRVKVVGKSPQQASTAIEELLQGSTVRPQVIVSQTGNLTSSTVVGGEVARPGPVGLGLRGERLLDVVALAGGSKYPAYETYVRLIRRNKSANVLLQSVVSNNAENIVMEPGDQLFLTRHQRSFSVFGAALRVAQYNIDAEKLTLAGAIAVSGGPTDVSGNPSGIYVFRFEPAPVARAVIAAAKAEPVQEVLPTDEFVPIVYRVDMRNSESFFLSQAFQIKDKDVLLVTMAEGAQLLKALTIARGFTGIVNDLRRVARD